jgi:hypothetical protein
MQYEDATSITTYGEQDIRIDMPYESDLNIAYGIAQWQTEVNKDARNTTPSITLIGNTSAALMVQCLAREPGDRIGIGESMTGVKPPVSGGESFFINGVDWTLDVGGIYIVRWVLVPAAMGGFWILSNGTTIALGSTLGNSATGAGNTILGFA